MNTMKKIEWTGWQGQSIANYATLRKKTSMYTYCIHVNNMYAASSTPLSVQLRVKWQVFRCDLQFCSWHNMKHDDITDELESFHRFWMQTYLQYRWVQVLLEELPYMVLQTCRKNTKHTTSQISRIESKVIKSNKLTAQYAFCWRSKNFQQTMLLVRGLQYTG